ncbi:MAG TPA: nitroreductase family protein [Candidatus Limosilactobacillus merdipullorum]|uniref:Nitroreductase family protein n=1 Tax=Candidatus Limosilactobacillus merdipullorum TaxID=2838653 RepID=A0A9D1QNX5_9LACO|nr:nitroreductase family protein [Candidatus Limosilactobacillus merdipullorum]
MLKAIAQRRSVRKFLAEPVDPHEVDELAAAFQAAPCGMHKTEVLRGVIVTDQQLRQEIEQVSNNACYGAPLLFILAVQKDSPFGERDASVAAENVMVQAAGLSLGSVYVMSGAMALNKHPELLKKLGLPTDFQAAVIVPVGKPAEAPAAEDRIQRYQLIRK